MKIKFFVFGFALASGLFVLAFYLGYGISSDKTKDSDIMGDKYKKIAMMEYAKENKIPLEEATYLRTPVVVLTNKEAYVELKANKGIMAPNVTYRFNLSDGKLHQKHVFSFFRENESDPWKLVEY